MLQFVEGAGTTDPMITNHPLYLNHVRRRLQFIGAVQRLRNARATAEHVKDGQKLNASTSGVPDQGIRRKHIEFWHVPREIILTMRTFTADLNSKLIGLEVNRAHMSTYIHQKRRRHRVMSSGTRRRLPNTIQNQYPTANLPTMR
jgi:hypothetical protein